LDKRAGKFSHSEIFLCQRNCNFKNFQKIKESLSTGALPGTWKFRGREYGALR
jgi:hypothetical protein